MGAERLSPQEELARLTRTALWDGDHLLAAAGQTVPAMVAQLEQAIGSGALPVEVAIIVGQARQLAARIHAARARSRDVLARWA